MIKREGRQTRRSLKTTDRALSRRLLAALRQRPDPVPEATVRRRTLRHYADLYVAGRSHPPCVKRDKIHRNLLRDWPGGAEVPAERVTPADVSRWLSRYSASSSTWSNLHLAFLRAALALALGDRAVDTNAAAGVKRRRKKVPVRRTLSPVQFTAILADVRAHGRRHRDFHAADFIEFLGLAGLGTIEASSLTWGDVDFETGRLTTYRHKISTPFAIPIYLQLRPLLERLWTERRAARLDGKVPPHRMRLPGACR